MKVSFDELNNELDIENRNIMESDYIVEVNGVFTFDVEAYEQWFNNMCESKC